MHIGPLCGHSIGAFHLLYSFKMDYTLPVKVEALLLENVTWQMSAALVMNLEDEL